MLLEYERQDELGEAQKQRMEKQALTCVGFGCSFIQVSSIFDAIIFLPISEALNTEAFLPTV